LIETYLERFSGPMKEEIGADLSPTPRCIYTPHSLRASTATLLLETTSGHFVQPPQWYGVHSTKVFIRRVAVVAEAF
jgi:hypothetical protein